MRTQRHSAYVIKNSLLIAALHASGCGRSLDCKEWGLSSGGERCALHSHAGKYGGGSQLCLTGLLEENLQQSILRKRHNLCFQKQIKARLGAKCGAATPCSHESEAMGELLDSQDSMTSLNNTDASQRQSNQPHSENKSLSYESKALLTLSDISWERTSL